MGMYSNFYIRVLDKNGKLEFYLLEEMKEKLEKINKYNFRVGGDMIRSGDEFKWYDYELDMVKLSREYPDFTFEVFREYEEGDWLNSNGMLQTSHQFRIFKNGEVTEKKLELRCI